MRTFYIRRKDLSHVPFQYYVYPDGASIALPPGLMSTFVIEPPKSDIGEMHVQIVEEFARELETRWGIPRADMLRVAAKALEAWVKDPSAAPADHFYGPGMMRVDAAWCPREPDGSPSSAPNPYTFKVETDEPWPSILDWDPHAPRAPDPAPPPAPEDSRPRRTIVFGFTLDVFPGLLIVGYNQMKHKVAEAGINARVSMSALGDLPPGVDVLFVPPELEQVARAAAPGARVEVLDNFLNYPGYNTLVEAWSAEAA